MENIRNIIESLLFVADEPLTVDKLKSVLETANTKEIRAALNALADQYAARGGGFRLCEVAGGWQLRSRPEYNEYIKRLLQPSPQRLSRAALETLAIVAYNQPIIRADIEHIRGVDCGGMLRQLLERKLIRVLGRKEIPGRPLIYATSKLFLELFELKNLKDLPTPKEIEEIGTLEQNAKDAQAINHNNDSVTSLSDSVTQTVTPETTFSDSPMLNTVPLTEAGLNFSKYPSVQDTQRQPQTNPMPAKISADPHQITTKASTLSAKYPLISGKSNTIRHSASTAAINPAADTKEDTSKDGMNDNKPENH